MFAHKTLFWILFAGTMALLGIATGLALQLLLGEFVAESSPVLSDALRKVPQPVAWGGYVAAGLALGWLVSWVTRGQIADLTAIALKSIRQRLLASAMTALSVALGVALMVTILVIHGVVTRVFNQSATGYDLVLGAKGSPMQLVLNTIYFMDRPIENVPYSEYLKIKKANWVAAAIPFNLGDYTDDARYRVVGTIPEYFQHEYIPGRKFQLREGTFLKDTQDAVLGSRVARDYQRTRGWKIGTQFPLAHAGNVADLHTDNPFKVVGILEPTGTPSDRAVFVHLEGFYNIPGHLKPEKEAMEKKRGLEGEAAVKPGEEQDPNLKKEVTAVLVKSKFPILGIVMRARINEANPYFQAANPIEQIQRLLTDVVRNIRTMLVVMTSLIIVVSGVGIFVSIYNSMADRRREIAIMRALGANRTTVFSIIVAESILICLAGGIAGLVLGHALVFAAGGYIEENADILIDPWAFESTELVLIPALVLLAVLVGLVPGLTAYRADVAKGLAE